MLSSEPVRPNDPYAWIDRYAADLHQAARALARSGEAARVSDVTAFFWLGKLVECDRTNKIFTAPAQKLTERSAAGHSSWRRRRPWAVR